MFFHRYNSGPMHSISRGPSGPLTAAPIEVSIEFSAAALDDQGRVLPSTDAIDSGVRSLFEGKLLIDNSDPYADDLIKLKRIRAAEPVLFDHGTSGPQLAFYVARWAEDWLSRERWNPSPDDVRHVQVVLAQVQIGRDLFSYDLE